MIVKNEEETIERILISATKFADEIIIVDTGSTDNTISIASRYTQNIYHFTWCEDFSKARNYSFSLATKDYIMWLDADDVITEENINKILNLKKNYKNISVYMCKYLLFTKGLTHPNLEYYRERILRRSDNYKWQGFVHEVITPHSNIEYTSIEIEHRKEQSGEPKRNLNIYRKALKRGVILSAREQYYYARELYYNGYYTSAITHLKKFLKMENKYIANEIEATILLSDIYHIQSKLNLAKKTLLDYLRDHPPTSEICCKLGNIFLDENITNSAIFWYDAATIAPTQKYGFINPDYDNFIPYLSLCQIYYNLGKKDIAKTFHEKATKIHPTHPSIIYNSQFFK